MNPISPLPWTTNITTDGQLEVLDRNGALVADFTYARDYEYLVDGAVKSKIDAAVESALEDQAERFESDILSLQKINDDLEKEVEQLQGRLDDQLDKVDELNDLIASLQEKNDELHRIVDASER